MLKVWIFRGPTAAVVVAASWQQAAGALETRLGRMGLRQRVTEEMLAEVDVSFMSVTLLRDRG